MAENDDFLDGDEGSGADQKDGKKGGAPFASAFILQVLKWIAIGLGGILFVFTVSFITYKVLDFGNTDNQRIDEPGPEYEAVVPVLSWYGQIGELRGTTNDETRHTFVVTPQLGYPDQDATTQNELISKQVQITDMLLSWFASRNGSYLKDIKNREDIRETIKAEVNKMLVRPIMDVRFTSFQILDF